MYPREIAAELLPIPLPWFDEQAPERYPYGARSEGAIFVGDLLHAEVPSLAADGDLEIVAIARRPGVLSKVAIRPRAGIVAPLFVGIGADHLARVSHALDGERIQVVRWQRSASGYITDALGLAEIPPIELMPWLGHARVLLGEIDVRGMAGWRGLNAILASALTGWRIRLEPVAATGAWARLQAAMLLRRPVVASVIGSGARSPRVEVHGLYAVLSGGDRGAPVGQEVDVRITRMDPDEGRITAAVVRQPGRGQLPLAI